MSRAAPKPAARSRRPVEAGIPDEAGPRSARESRVVRPPRARQDSEIQELTVPPGERPSRNNLPGSIEEAVLALLDQVPRTVSVPPPRNAGAADTDVDER